MHIHAEPARPDRRADLLLVLLPGAYNTPEHFLAAGFPEALHARPGEADLLLPELDLGHITDGSALRRLHEEVMRPALAQGYREIWLGGVSLGGLIALNYAEAHPEVVTGLCLLAPYPGSRITTTPIRAAGLAAWEPAEGQLADPEIRAWHWFKHRAGKPTPVFLGYGRSDRFADGIELMCEALPEENVCCLPGGHDWLVWRALWENFLAGSFLPAATEAAAN